MRLCAFKPYVSAAAAVVALWAIGTVAQSVLQSGGRSTLGASFGMTIESTNTEFQQVNGFLMQNQTATVLASPGEYWYTVQTVNQTISNVSFVVDTPIQYYVRTYVWSIPRDVILTSCVACLTQNTYQFNSTAGGTTGFETPPPPVPYNQTGEIGNRLAGGWGDVSSVLSTIGCSYINQATYGIAGAFGGPCAPGGTNGITADEFAAFGNQVADQFARQDDLIRSLTQWQAAANNQYQFIIDGFQATRAFQVATQQQVGNLTIAVTNQQSQINNIMRESAAIYGQIKSVVVDVATNMNNLTQTMQQLASATASTFNQTILYITQNMNTLADQVNTLTDANNNNTRNNQAKDLTTQSAISKLSAITALLATQSQFLPLLTRNWRVQKQRIRSRNSGGQFNYVPMVVDPGSDGVDDLNDLPPRLQTQYIDVPGLKWIGRAGPILGAYKALAISTQLAFTCSGPYLANNQNPISTWTDFFNTLGAFTNCNVTGSTYMCNCWVAATSEYCEMDANPATGAPTAWALANWTLYDAPDIPLPGNPYYYCNSNKQNLPGAPLSIIRSDRDWFLYQKYITAQLVNPAPSVPQGYRIFSPLFGQRIFVPYAPITNTTDIMTIMNPAVGTPNFVYVTIQAFFIQGMSLSATAAQRLSQEIYGGMPTNSTILTEDYVKIGSNPLGVCKTMYVVATDTSKFVSLYRYEKVALTRKITVFLDGQEYSQITDATVINSRDSTLQIPDGAYIGGIEGEQWVTSVYDQAYEQTVPNFNPIGREGNPWYNAYPTSVNAQPTKFTYNISTWNLYNIVPYDHLAGSSSINKFRNTLVCNNQFNPPRCVCNTTSLGVANNGRICSMLPVYQVSYVNAFVNGRGADIGLTSSFDQQRATIRVPSGVLTAVSGSACLVVTQVQTENFKSQTLVLYNSLATPNTVIITENSACFQKRQITFSPLQRIPYIVDYCPIQDPAIPIAVTFSFFGGNTSLPIACGTVYNVSIDPTNPPSTTGVNGASFTTTEILRAQTTDVALLSSQVLQIQMIGLLQDTIYAMVQTLGLNRVVLSNSSSNPLGAFDPIFTRINQLNIDASNTVIAAKNITTTYSNQTIAFTAATNTALDAANYAGEVAKNATRDLAISINNQQDNLLVLISSLQNSLQLLNTSRDSIIFLRDTLNQIVAAARARAQNSNLNFFDALTSIGDFLVGVGEWSVGVASGAAAMIQDLAGGALDSFKNMFGSLSGLFAPVIFILIIAAVGIGLFCIITKCAPGTSNLAMGDVSRLKSLEQDIAAIKKALNMRDVPVPAGLGGGSSGLPKTAVAIDLPPKAASAATGAPKTSGRKKKSNYQRLQTAHEIQMGDMSASVASDN